MPKRDQFHMDSFLKSGGPTRIEIHFKTIDNRLPELGLVKELFEVIKD